MGRVTAEVPKQVERATSNMMSARILMFVLIVASPGIPSWGQHAGAGGALNSVAVAMDLFSTGIGSAAAEVGSHVGGHLDIWRPTSWQRLHGAAGYIIGAGEGAGTGVPSALG